jgi:hypothetical protein
MVKYMEFLNNFVDAVKGRRPSDDEIAIYSFLISDEGKVFVEWLRKRTIEKHIGYGVQDGIQTALLTARELGRCDIYHEVNRLILKVSSYVNRK